jgi:hypothetical protein
MAKKLAFLTQNKAKLCNILIITLVFEKNANFFAENWQKSQKNVIITSTPDGFQISMPAGKNLSGMLMTFVESGEGKTSRFVSPHFKLLIRRPRLAGEKKLGATSHGRNPDILSCQVLKKMFETCSKMFEFFGQCSTMFDRGF